jgi:tetratricopeptide (TPR) repeat protein
MPGVPSPSDVDPESSTSVDERSRRARRAWAVRALLLALYLVTFVRTSAFDFVWDDPTNFAYNPLMRGPLAGVIRKGEHARSDPTYERMAKDLVPEHESYRPVSIASHWTDVRLFGSRPGPMHLHSVLLGVLSILLVAMLGRKLGLGLWLPALWALHPLHVEVFAYISARSDLLAGIFSLSALLAAVRSAEGERARSRLLWASAAGLAQLLSLLAKEANLGLPFAVLALAVARGNLRKSLASVAAMLLATAGYFPLRLVLMDGSSLPMAQHGAVLHSLLDCPGIVLAYLHSFFLPFSLSPDRQLWAPWVPLGWLALGLLGLAFFVMLRRTRRTPVHSDLFLAAMALVALGPMLLPAAVGVRNIGGLSDRYVFLPFLFVAVAVGAAGRAASACLPGVPGWLRRGPVAVWGTLLVAITWLQVGAWKNEETLARYAVAVEPDNPTALYRLATVDTSRQRFAEALPILERATSLDPGNQRALGNLAVAYLNLNRVADAKATLRRLLPLAGATDKRFWYNVASVQWADGKRDKSCAALARALAIDPGYPLALAMRDAICGDSTRRAPSAAPPATPDESPRP